MRCGAEAHGRRRMRCMVHRRCVQTLRPAAPPPPVAFCVFALARALVASAIAPEPVASAVANAIVSTITQRHFFRMRVNNGGIRRFDEDSREGAQAR